MGEPVNEEGWERAQEASVRAYAEAEALKREKLKEERLRLRIQNAQQHEAAHSDDVQGQTGDKPLAEMTPAEKRARLVNGLGDYNIGRRPPVRKPTADATVASDAERRAVGETASAAQTIGRKAAEEALSPAGHKFDDARDTRVVRKRNFVRGAVLVAVVCVVVLAVLFAVVAAQGLPEPPVM